MPRRLDQLAGLASSKARSQPWASHAVQGTQTHPFLHLPPKVSGSLDNFHFLCYPFSSSPQRQTHSPGASGSGCGGDGGIPCHSHRELSTLFPRQFFPGWDRQWNSFPWQGESWPLPCWAGGTGVRRGEQATGASGRRAGCGSMSFAGQQAGFGCSVCGSPEQRLGEGLPVTTAAPALLQGHGRQACSQRASDSHA